MAKQKQSKKQENVDQGLQDMKDQLADGELDQIVGGAGDAGASVGQQQQQLSPELLLALIAAKQQGETIAASTPAKKDDGGGFRNIPARGFDMLFQGDAFVPAKPREAPPEEATEAKTATPEPAAKK